MPEAAAGIAIRRDARAAWLSQGAGLPQPRKSGTQRPSMLATFNKVMNLCLVAAFSVVLIGVIRTRWTRRYDIKPSEIHPDLEAGEELLRDALNEDAHRDTEPAIEDEPH